MSGGKILRGGQAAAEIYKIAMHNQNHFRGVAARSREIRAEALARLAEIGDHSGCEAASARAFEEGRLAALDALELGHPAEGDEVIRQRRLEFNAALGTPKLRGSVDDEPIVR